MFCEQCGVAIKAGAQFCEGCGAPIATAPNKSPQTLTIRKGTISITKEQLNLAGWLSITNAAVTVPVEIISFLGAVGGAGVKTIDVILTLVTAGLVAYILLSLKKLLNSRFQFHDADTSISVFVGLYMVFSVLSCLPSLDRELEAWIRPLLLLGIIPAGIVSIVFAIRLLRLSDNLYGLLKPFSYVTIASGICLVTIILMPLETIVGVVQDVILGMIFFRAAERS